LDLFFYIGLTSYLLCLLWLTVTSTALGQRSLEDPTALRRSWWRVVAPAIASGLAAASFLTLTLFAPGAEDALRASVVLWTALFFAFTAAALLSAAFMVAAVRSRQRFPFDRVSQRNTDH